MLFLPARQIRRFLAQLLGRPLRQTQWSSRKTVFIRCWLGTLNTHNRGLRWYHSLPSRRACSNITVDVDRRGFLLLHGWKPFEYHRSNRQTRGSLTNEAIRNVRIRAQLQTTTRDRSSNQTLHREQPRGAALTRRATTTAVRIMLAPARIGNNAHTCVNNPQNPFFRR